MPNDKWDHETEALKKIQMQFEFQEDVNKMIIVDAAEENIKPSDLVRKLTGLSYKKIQRSRVAMSLSSEDITNLAQRLGVDESNELEIKKRVTAEINLHYYDKKDKSNDDS
jgi:hypothetical protein